MANLFWKRNDRPTLNLVSTPFKSEDEFEKVVFDTKEILGDVFLIQRQVRGGGKKGIPDIIGIDKNNNVCIVEMKNVTVDATIIPQVLGYAIWAERNPDAIKNLWLVSKQQPRDVAPDWDNYKVRIIIIAPSIDPSTLGLVNRIDYQVDLIEIKRWVEGHNHFLLVNILEPEQAPKTLTARGREVYDTEFYKSHFNKDSAVCFLQLAEEIRALAKVRKWPVELKFNKYYCGFKYGSFIAFSIDWWSTKTLGMSFKVPKGVAKRLLPHGVKLDPGSDSDWSYWRIDPEKTRAKDFVPLFERAVQSFTGKSTTK